MEIIGCPWCGKVPNMYETKHGGFYLECENYACPVQPQSQVFSHKADLVKHWNKRQNVYWSNQNG